jgi:hypothetical protein
MKYIIQLIYRRCWEDAELRSYIRMYLSDMMSDDIMKEDPERLMTIINVLDMLAARCLGESDDLPPPI